MKKAVLRKIFLIISFALLFLLINTVTSNAGYQRLDSLDYTVDLYENGDMKITEVWDVYIEDTNTLFKTFLVDGSYDNITNISVSQIKNGIDYDFIEVYSYSYHVTKDYFQGLINPDGDFEIAWGVDVESGTTNTYKISYTVKNHITLYNDCAEMYWKLVGEDFGINAKKVTGVINLPNGISDIDNLKVWAHGPLNGSIERISEKQVAFSVNDLKNKTFLEIRLATPINIFESSFKREYVDRLEEIIEEETILANEANELRQRKESEEKIIKAVLNIIAVLLICITAYKIPKNSTTLSRTEKKVPTQKFDYFRDIPDEKASPAEAVFLYNYNRGGVLYVIDKVLSATMLNICLKKWIEFEMDSNDSKKVIVILNKDGKEELTEDENIVYQYLLQISKDTYKLTMKDFEKYSKSNPSKFQKMLQNINKESEERNVNNSTYSVEERKTYNKWLGSGMLSIFISIMSFGLIMLSPLLGIILIIISTINAIVKFKISNRINGLTQKGIDEQEKWNGLHKFMKDFSMLDEREVPELVLWEKYLVYATAFGIADQVLKQLKVRFPQFQDEEYMRSHSTYLYMVCNQNVKFNLIENMSSSIGSSVNYSSGGGSGGGFSGGGGGRWWRWRRWRSLKQILLKKQTI